MTGNEKGQTLVELIAVVSIIGCIASAGFVTSMTVQRRIALSAATSELRALFQQVRLTAIAHNRNVAIRFRPAGDLWSWNVYEDGDGDGVRNDDISRGVDFPIGKTRIFQHPPVRIGVPSAPIPDPATGQPLSLRLPVRFGTSMLCSFSRTGEATNGSVVLTDGRNVTIIHVTGSSARIYVSRWNGTKWIAGA